MEQLPACALICLGHAAEAANCSTTDIACTCESEVFTNYATPCITETCTVREALFTQNQTAVQCHVQPYVDNRLIPVVITFFIITLIVLLLRLAARVVSQAKFWYDDYFNIAAFASIIVHTGLTIALSKDGLGVDVWAVPQENISYLLTLSLVGSCLYLATRMLIRVSILLFYLRIFHTPGAKGVITWTLAVAVIYSFILLFPAIFQCSPVGYLWLQWDGTHQGHCINHRAFVWAVGCISIALDFWAVGCISIALDFWAVLIAFNLASRLQLPRKKKIMVSVMFTVGLVAIAISIARLPYINQFTQSENPSIDWVPITIWSSLENDIGLICACLPSLPALLKTRPALKILGSIKSNPLKLVTSQRTQGSQQELGPQRHVSAYEMTPLYGKATDAHRGDGSPAPGNQPQIYHNFNNSEREIP